MVYQENLALLAEREPGLAASLEGVALQGVEWGTTRQGEKNLALEGCWLHGRYSAEKELERVGEKESLEGVKVGYFLGLGLGHAYTALRGWLHGERDRYLVFLERDLRVIKSFLHMEEAGALLRDSRVTLAHLSGGEEEEERLVQQLTNYFVRLPFKVWVLPSSFQLWPEESQRVQLALMHRSTLVSFGSIEFLNYGVSFFQNYYQNIQKLPGSVRVKGLYERFRGVPAVICGAGPSLNKNLSLLKELQDRALIFAGGSSLKALASQGIWPHFGGSVDPNPEQFERMSSHGAPEVPLFFKGRVHYRAFQTFHGPRIYLPGNNGYPITQWVDGQLGLEDPPLAEGYNVINLMMDVARELGCDPIIFVGMDLAFTGMQAYASGVVAQSGVSEQAITKGTELNDNAFLRQDIFGQPLYTLWKWVAESSYTGKYAARHSDRTFINATEGGLGFPSIPNLPLKEVAEQYLTRSWDLLGWVHGELENHLLHEFKEQEVVDCLYALENSIEGCAQGLKEIQQKLSELLEGVEAGDPLRISEVSKEIEQLQTSLSSEVAYEELLVPVNTIRSIMFEREMDQGEERSVEEGEKALLLQAVRSQIEECQTLEECCRVNLMLLRPALPKGTPRLPNREPLPLSEPVLEERREEGEVVYRFPDGQMASRSQWSQGKREGVLECWSREGQLLSQRNFSGGKLHGVHRYFYPSGQEKTSLVYEKGAVQGEMRLWHGNGQLKRVSSYVKGKAHGSWKEWSSEGHPLLFRSYFHGECEWERFFSQGGELLEERVHHLGLGRCDKRRWDSQGVFRYERVHEEERFVHREWNGEGELVKEYSGVWKGETPRIEKVVKGGLTEEERGLFSPSSDGLTECSH